MTIRSILVPVRGDDKGEGVLDHAVALGARFAAHLDVVHCRPKPEDLIPFSTMMMQGVRETILSSATTAAEEEEKHLRQLFDAYCARHDMAEVERPPGPDRKLSASWREETGKMPSVVAVRGRLADIICVAKPDRAAQIGHNTLEAALLETGKMVMMCPPEPAISIGVNIAVAWNGSAEAARAVTQAMPLLAKAQKVRVLAGSEIRDGLGAEQAVDYLGWHGISAESAEVGGLGNDVAPELLKAAAAAGTDSMVMGAYGQRRRRELVMGSVTQHVIDHAALPIIMVH